jgi:hypothetical protein
MSTDYSLAQFNVGAAHSMTDVVEPNVQHRTVVSTEKQQSWP